jgi:hypothetical protein
VSEMREARREGSLELPATGVGDHEHGARPASCATTGTTLPLVEIEGVEIEREREVVGAHLPGSCGTSSAARAAPASARFVA